MAFNRTLSMIRGKGTGSPKSTRSMGGSAPKAQAPAALPNDTAKLPPSVAEPNMQPPAPIAPPQLGGPGSIPPLPEGMQAPQQVNILPVGEPQVIQPPMQPVESPAAPAPKPKAGQIRQPDTDEIGKILRRRPPKKAVKPTKRNIPV